MSENKKTATTAGEFDPASDLMFKLQDFWMKNKVILIIVVALILGSVVFVGLKANAEKAKEAKASLAFSQARAADSTQLISNLSTVYSEHSGTVYARYSAYLVAQEYLSANSLDSAIIWFDKAIALKGDGIIIEPESLEGKGIAYESKGDLENAKKMYKTVLSQKISSHRAKSVSLKLALIAMKEGDLAGAESYCNTIVSDTTMTTADTYNAQDMLATIAAKKK